MGEIDTRKPALVTEAFRAHLGERLVALGFEARAQGKSFVRKRGKNVHRVELQSSYRNAPGYAVAWPSLVFEDAATRKLEKGWRAGGLLGGPSFGAIDAPRNVANADDAEALVSLVLERVSFFDWLETPERVRSDVSSRYVAGLVDPHLIVPYLHANLGEAAAEGYAACLLAGRPELAPAFLGASKEESGERAGLAQADHGTQLARALRGPCTRLLDALPRDTACSRLAAARHLRCFFGRQLRAFGERAAAHALHRAEDEDVVGTHTAQKASKEPLTSSVEAARLALALATGEDRAPRRDAPVPRFFQYFAHHMDAFAPGVEADA